MDVESPPMKLAATVMKAVLLFGKRIGGAARRHNECLILEHSEMIVIDYVDGRGRTERILDSSSSMPISSTGSSGSLVTTTTAPSNKTTLEVSGTNSVPEVTIAHSTGTFVDDSESSVDDIPPPPPPRNHALHQQMRINTGNSLIVPTNGSSTYLYHGNHADEEKNRATTAVIYQKHIRSSHSSDSSSAYSGSDTMLQGSINDEHNCTGGQKMHTNEVDLTGLMESVVDSDEEEFEEEDQDLSETSLVVRDAVRECLEKDPSDRTEDDIDVLLEFTQHLKAFTNMTQSVRRALVGSMVFAVVEKAGTVVMTEGEELDSWSVIINGQVEIVDSKGIRELGLGDSFGITPTMDKLYHRGVMRTKCDDCQFVCVTQGDYYRILHQGVENQRVHEEEGKVVLVTENRRVEISDQHKVFGHVVIRGTIKKLLDQLMEDNTSSSIDPTYVEDFLLTYRTFLDSPVRIMQQLLEWFKDVSLRDKVTRVLLLWVNNHFTDFETDPDMMEHLERFEASLEAEKMFGQLRMLNFACAAKARRRTVTLTRPSRDEPLQFSIIGGYERGCGIFVSKVEKGSKAADIGLKRGDQVLEVNGQSFEHVTKLSRALEVLKSVCHLSITVKSNLLAFNELLHSPDDSKYQESLAQGQARQRGKSVGALSPSASREILSSIYSGSDGALSSIGSDGNSQPTSKKGSKTVNSPAKVKAAASQQANKGSRLNKAFNKLMLHKPKSLLSVAALDTSADSSDNHPNAASNPDLRNESAAQIANSGSDTKSEFPEHVLKVYKADQTFKYLLVHKETTAHEVVMLSLQEFGITEPSSNFTLCEVSVADGGFVKQRRLPDALQNLAERIGLASRYYIKNIHTSDALLPDESVSDLVKEANVNLLQLNPVEVSTQLMVEDFTIFRQIEATEYVEDLFNIKSHYGRPNLSLFSELVNREMMWTITEVVSEPNTAKRMRVIKQFIKIARQCKESQNFNSMFAIISGLGHGAVSRLKSTWEKLPSKYQRMFHEMQQLMDPSRNMSKYRNLVNSDEVQPPIIPFYPVVKKDLTFIHLANDSNVDELINFEKLRMIAKEVRTLTNMCSAPLDLFSMLELGGHHPSTAMVAMNQLTAGGQYLATVNRSRNRKKASGMPNPKRMYEEAHMVRRVKAYLNKMKIIYDEEKLHQMSLECEPSVGMTPQMASVASHLSVASAHQPAVIRRRNTSPSPSNRSTTSSQHSQNSASNNTISSMNENNSSKNLNNKFGATSPHAVKKLLSLSEQGKSRPASNSSRTGSESQIIPVSGIHHSPVSQSSSHEDSSSAVDLTAESSSVTSHPAKRKAHGSVTSTDSGILLLHDNSPPKTSELLSHSSAEAISNFSRHLSRSQHRHNHHHHHHHHHHQHQHGSSTRSKGSLSLHEPSSELTRSMKHHPHQHVHHHQHQHPVQAKPVESEDKSVNLSPLVKPHSLLHSNNFARLLTSSSRLNAIPPLPPPKNPTRGSTVPTYYVAEDEDEDEEDEETQVSAV